MNIDTKHIMSYIDIMSKQLIVYCKMILTICKYNIGNMSHNNRTPNPCKCFEYLYNGYKLKGVGGFNEFISCEIIDSLVNNFI